LPKAIRRSSSTKKTTKPASAETSLLPLGTGENKKTGKNPVMFFKNENERPAGPRRPLPALPLRDIIVFPHMVSQLFVGREKSIAALDEAMARDKEIFLAAQKSAKTNDPTPDDIYAVGTVGTIVQLLRLADGTVKVLVEGRSRARVRRWVETRDVFLVEVDEISESVDSDLEVEALIRSVQSTFEVYVKLNK